VSVVTDELLRSFLRFDEHNASLLGAPPLHGAELDKSWSGRCDDLARAAERLGEIGCQDALTLLRSNFSAPKVLRLLRCAPSVSHSALQTFDSLLKDSVQRITNSNLSDIQWLQASLPVKDGIWGCEMYVFATFACNSRLFGISCKHTLPPGGPSLMICTFKLT